jgi:hypothetical protein
MSYIPHFLNWGSALATTAIAIPALLILYFLKLRRREMPVPSTLLWRKAIQDLQVNAPFQKLRRNLLLLLQLLMLLALLLAFSRPVTSYRPPPGAVSVILIDHSASMSATDMNGHSRLDEAKRRARDLVDSMQKNSSAMVIAFDNTAQTLQSFTSDPVMLKNAIDSIEPTDRTTRLKLAYELADAPTNFNPDQLRSIAPQADVYLFSDGRASDAADLGIRGRLHFERLGTDTAANVGIVALSAKRNYERPTQVQIFAHLENFGPEPVEAPVQLSVDGKVVEVGGARTQSAFLLPSRWDKDQRDKYEAGNGRRQSDTATFELDITTAAIIKVEQLHREGDVLAADDAAEVVVPPPKQLAVLLVIPPDGNYFLGKAIQHMRLKSPEIIQAATYEEQMAANDPKLLQHDVFMFDRYTPKAVPASGNFIYFGAVPPPSPGPGQKVTTVVDAGGDPLLLKDEEVLDWQRDNPMLKDLELNRLYIAQSLKLSVPPDAQTLVDGLKGPLVVLAHDGKRTNLIVAFDTLQSNWPFQPSFPMFLRRALQYMAIGSDMDVRQSFQPGASPVIPRPNLQRAGVNLKEIKLLGPMGPRTLAIPDTGDFALPALDRVGVYTTDPPVPQFEKIAVNLLDSNESNTLPAAVAPGDSNVKAVDVRDQTSRREWWWYLVAFIGLPLLFVEWWVYTRRVHL